MSYLHDASLYLLCAAFALIIYLIIERSIGLAAYSRELEGLLQWRQGKEGAALRSEFAPQGLGFILKTHLQHFRDGQTLNNRTDDEVEGVYIQTQAKLNQSLWILDTVVTVAPLLGLLGTILGIFDTFSALAQSGISDPKGVSAGIGAALLATAMGIGVALLSVLAYNVFLAWVEKLNERVKLILLNIPNPLPAPVSEPLAGLASVGAEKA